MAMSSLKDCTFSDFFSLQEVYCIGTRILIFTVTEIEPPPVVRVMVPVPTVLKGAYDKGVNVMFRLPPAFSVVPGCRLFESQLTLAPVDKVPVSLPQLVTVTVTGVDG